VVQVTLTDATRFRAYKLRLSQPTLSIVATDQSGCHNQSMKGMENLRQYRPGGMLAEGETNQAHRVRAAADVNAWFAAMTAVERGAVVAAAYVAAHAGEGGATPDDLAEGASWPSGALEDTGNVAAVLPARPQRRSMRTGGIPRTDSVRLALSVPYLNVMQRPMMRGLGWKPERYDRVNRMLGEGDTLTADGVNYRTAAGSLMDYRTAEALVRLGVLVPA